MLCALQEQSAEERERTDGHLDVVACDDMYLYVGQRAAFCLLYLCGAIPRAETAFHETNGPAMQWAGIVREAYEGRHRTEDDGSPSGSKSRGFECARVSKPPVLL